MELIIILFCLYCLIKLYAPKKHVGLIQPLQPGDDKALKEDMKFKINRQLCTPIVEGVTQVNNPWMVKVVMPTPE